MYLLLQILMEVVPPFCLVLRIISSEPILYMLSDIKKKWVLEIFLQVDRHEPREK